MASVAVTVAAVLTCAGGVVGQEVYQLEDDDTWVLTDAPRPGSPAAQLAEARRALAKGQPALAEALATNWLARHDRHPLEPEVYLVRADALVAQDDAYKALFDYEYIARNYPGHESFVTALERELAIARLYAAGKRRKLWGIRFVSAEDEAEELFIRIQERMPGSRLAEEAGISLGDFYFDNRDMEMAAEAYDLFIVNYPGSTYVSKARRRLIYAHLAVFKGPSYDATGLYEARARLRDLVIREPATAQQIGAEGLLKHINERDAQKLLSTAQWYMRRDDPISAELTIRRLLRTYPNSLTARDALRMVEEDVLPRLSPYVRAEAPDYATMREALAGTVTDDPASAGDAENGGGGGDSDVPGDSTP